MNKIINSFIGGFFRRLGSIFAFLLVLFIVSYFLKDVKINVSDLLGISKVSALEVDGNRQRNIDFFGSSDSNLHHNISTCGSSGMYNYDISAVNTFTATDNEKFAVIYFNKTIMQRLNDTSGISSYNDSYMTPFFALKSNSSWSYCEIHDNFIICPLTSGVTYNGLRIRYQKFRTSDGVCVSWQNWEFDIDRYVPTYNSANSIDVINSINNVNQSQQETNEKLDDLNNTQKETNEILKDDDTSEASDEAEDFFNNFDNNTHGLTGIITAPLNLIESLSSSTCRPLILPLPFVNEDLTLPCMRQIYVDTFGNFMNIYDIITLGIVSYWIMVRLFAMVKDFKNPEHDEIEVMEL